MSTVVWHMEINNRVDQGRWTFTALEDPYKVQVDCREGGGEAIRRVICLPISPIRLLFEIGLARVRASSWIELD